MKTFVVEYFTAPMAFTDEFAAEGAIGENVEFIGHLYFNIVHDLFFLLIFIADNVNIYIVFAGDVKK